MAADFDAVDAAIADVCCGDGFAGFCPSCDLEGLEELCSRFVRQLLTAGCCCCALPVSSSGRSNSPDERSPDEQACHLKINSNHELCICFLLTAGLNFLNENKDWINT